MLVLSFIHFTADNVFSFPLAVQFLEESHIMNEVIHFKFCVIFVAAFVSVIGNSIMIPADIDSAVSYSIENTSSNSSFSCAAFSGYALNGINCSLSFNYDPEHIEPKCINSTENWMWAAFYRKDFKNAIFDPELMCDSDSLASVMIDFQRGIVIHHYTEIRQERLVKNFTDTISYRYRLHLIFSNGGLHDSRSILVKYSVFLLGDIKNNVDIVLEFFDNISSDDIDRIYYTSYNPIEVSSEELIIPCLKFVEDSETFQFVDVDISQNQTKDVLNVVNKTLPYNPRIGFKINTSIITTNMNLDVHYLCGYKRKSEAIFSNLETKIRFRDMRFIPMTYLVFVNENNYNILEKRNKPIVLSCSSFSKNVTITFTKADGECIESPPGFTTTVEVPVNKSAEPTKLANLHMYKCHDEDKTTSPWGWGIIYKRKPPLRFRHLQKAFTCERFSISTFRNMKCNTVTQCEIFLTKCVDEYDVEDSGGPLCNYPIYDERIQQCSDINVDQKRDKCLYLQPLDKGIIQCKGYLAVLRPFIYQVTYFKGFDGHFYVESEMNGPPPINAILKLEAYEKSNYFYINETFYFRCEANSFYYENGIHWLLKYYNGNSKTVQNGTILTQSNPESIISVFLEDKQLKQIICYAPVLNSRAWDLVFMNITIIDSVAPHIVGQTELYVKQGDDSQTITCQTNGIPEPEVKWTRFNKDIEDDIRILNNKTLLFPIFKKSFYGDYTCTASNVAGKFVKTFVIKRKTNDNLALYAVIIVPMKKYREMKEIIRLLDGDKNNDTPNEEDLVEHSDPTLLLFDSDYEIKKNSFFIDRKKFLGMGEFGEVYKGLLDGVDGFVAFKTVKRKCPLTHLRALVKELKVHMYIGNSNDNLVKLYGAYREEIDQGVLHVAIEFCDLGCLESYLRNNKHLFLKCPVLNFNNTEGQTICPVQEFTDLTRLHSMKSLLVWSWQISIGMEFLGAKNVVHSDLATRNVLLTAEGNAKVADFGLSRRMYDLNEYQMKTEKPLPWRWLAPESLLTKTFSCQFDVWAYGITIWEMFSLGEVPYATMEFGIEYVRQLEEGLRNANPKYASPELYELMLKCWLSEPNKRPSFSAIRMIFADAVLKNKVNIDGKVFKGSDIEEAAKALASEDYVDFIVL